MSVKNHKRGFASMDPKRQRLIAVSGGKAAHAKGTAHRFSHDEAVAAGQMRGKRKDQPPLDVVAMCLVQAFSPADLKSGARQQPILPGHIHLRLLPRLAAAPWHSITTRYPSDLCRIETGPSPQPHETSPGVHRQERAKHSSQNLQTHYSVVFEYRQGRFDLPHG